MRFGMEVGMVLKWEGGRTVSIMKSTELNSRFTVDAASFQLIPNSISISVTN